MFFQRPAVVWAGTRVRPAPSVFAEAVAPRGGLREGKPRPKLSYMDVIPAVIPEFGEREQQVLEFERFWWKYAGAKERAIKDNLDMSATRYYQLLNQIIDLPEALAYDPILVKRLQRLRAFRQRERVARRQALQAPGASSS